MTVDDLGGAATNLTYNAADRLVKVSAGGITLVDYVYAATGQRAIKATPLATTHYLYDPGGALYAETDGAGTVLREYITLGGATIAIVDAGGVNYVHSDHLATPQVMTDGAAAVVWDASYRPFGEATIAGAAANDQRFPGQTADAETGYHDNWYRTYDPSLGRYLQSDPIGIMAGFNTYAYVGGNPVMYADPTGELAFIPVFLVLADATGLGLTLYAIGDYGLRWHDNYRAGGCTDLWGAKPEISPLDVAFLLAGPAAKAGKLAFSALGLGAKAARFAGKLGANGPRNFVYRGLAAADNAGARLLARAPGAGNSVASHVAGKQASQWISTTKSESIAKNVFGENGYVRIDLSKVSNEIIDVSNGIPGLPSNSMLSNWARKFQEVVVKDYIPPNAITLIK